MFLKISALLGNFYNINSNRVPINVLKLEISVRTSPSAVIFYNPL